MIWFAKLYLVLNNFSPYLGISVVIGFLVDETVYHKYVTRRPTKKSRNLLITIWMIVGFLISSGFKSVLLSTLVSIEYERPIDTIDDLIETDMPIYMEWETMEMFMINSRNSIQELRKRVTPYNLTGHNQKIPESIKNR